MIDDIELTSVLDSYVSTIPTATDQIIGGIKIDGLIHNVLNDALKFTEPPSNTSTIANKILMYPPITDFFGISDKMTTVSNQLYGNGDYIISYTEAENDFLDEPSKVFNSTANGGHWL